jgi:biotin operon repressor
MATPTSKIEVRLSADQRITLQRLLRTGTHPAHARRRAAILLRADADGPDNWTDERIAEALGINRNTVWRVRTQFAAEGLDATLHTGGGGRLAIHHRRCPGQTHTPLPISSVAMDH